jgi:hypothetical protein
MSDYLMPSRGLWELVIVPFIDCLASKYGVVIVWNKSSQRDSWFIGVVVE